MNKSNGCIKINVSEVVKNYGLNPSELENEVEQTINANSGGFPNGAVDLVSELLTGRYGAVRVFKYRQAAIDFYARHKLEIDQRLQFHKDPNAPDDPADIAAYAFERVACTLAWESFDNECEGYELWEELISSL
mgnify:CR=1 FL=1|tara:strand:- start:270 stop:671 length:402 start_codon:yes stop_codon:yes gene_type:complete